MSSSCSLFYFILFYFNSFVFVCVLSLFNFFCFVLLSNWLKVANFWNAAHRRGVIRVAFLLFVVVVFGVHVFGFYFHFRFCYCGYWRSFMVFDYRICRNREANGRCRNINMTTLYITFHCDSEYNWRYFF